MTVERLALGTAQFGLRYGVANEGGRVPFESMRTILATATKSGMDTLDTAMAYGESEQRLGEIGVDRWHVVSKLPPVPDSVRDIKGWMVGHVVDSLARLKSRSLEGLLLHRPEQLLGRKGKVIWRVLGEIKRDALVEKIGFSVYDVGLLDQLQSFEADLVQAPLNIFDRRLIQSGWLQRLYSSGIEVHVRSIFLQGLLLMERDNLPARFSRWTNLWDMWSVWLSEQNISAADACIRFAMEDSRIHRVIIGVDSKYQLGEALSSIKNLLPLNPPERLSCHDIDLIDPSRWNLT